VRIVVDTNILWVSISRHSKSHWVLSDLIDGKYTLCVTTDVLEEYEEIIARKLGIETSKSIMELLDNLPNVEYITKFYNWNLIHEDYDDNKFVDCAIAGNAHFLASIDKHFNILKNIPFPKVYVINIDEFKILLESLKNNLSE
jgi:uncharacterized protein